jgi:hypothetical protein
MLDFRRSATMSFVGHSTLALASLGCATQYQPRMSPHISVIMVGGAPAYARDGQVFEHGIAGGGLVDAVAGDPEATEAAETFRNRTIGGLVSETVGLVCLAAGIGTASVRATQEQSPGTAAGAFMACGLAGSALSIVLLLTAQPYQMDAVNIYNDHVDARMYWAPRPGIVLPPPTLVPPPAPIAPPTAQPTTPSAPASAAPPPPMTPGSR